MPDQLTIQLVNKSNHPQVFAYITGLAIQRKNARVFLKPDGRSLYYPQSPCPGQILQPLAEDVAILLGPPDNTVTVTIPQIAGGRIWFSANEPLTFLLNPGGPGGGAALVEPSVVNPSDPNAEVDFAFCEFTLNQDQLFANISYVDFVSRLPVALTLQTRCGAGGEEVQHVSGMKGPDPLPRLAECLVDQARRDGWPWDKLVVRNRKGEILRILSPMHGDAVGASFEGYFEPLVEAAWERYREGGGGGGGKQSESSRPPSPPRPPSTEGQEPSGFLSRLMHRASRSSSSSSSPPPPPSRSRSRSRSRSPPPHPHSPCPTVKKSHKKTLRINTQCGFGTVTGTVPASDPSHLVIASEPFAKPSTRDILTCSTGPFATGPSALRNAIIPRLAAAFQRSTIAHLHGDDDDQCPTEHPSDPSGFYRCDGGPTNHYARIVHENNLDGQGYAFAYDDVEIDGGEGGQSGKVEAADPAVWKIEVGGRDAYV